MPITKLQRFLDGSELWRSQRYEEIALYCAHACWLTYACFCRMNLVEPVPADTLKPEIRILQYNQAAITADVRGGCC